MRGKAEMKRIQKNIFLGGEKPSDGGFRGWKVWYFRRIRFRVSKQEESDQQNKRQKKVKEDIVINESYNDLLCANVYTNYGKCSNLAY